MNIKQTDVRYIPLAHLRPNDGQIDGVPANPRQINEKEYAKLKKSLKADNLTGVMPLKVILHDGAYIVLGGNMRLRALRELGETDVPCIVVPDDAPVDVLRKIVVTDNSTFGEWDTDALANEWNTEELGEWGVELPDAISPDEFGTEFELPDGDKDPFQQMTFSLHDAQAEMVQYALGCAIGNAEYAEQDTYGNTNRNGNAIALIVKQWLEQNGYGKMQRD